MKGKLAMKDSAKVTWEEIERLLGNNIERFVKHYATNKYRTSTQNNINDYKHRYTRSQREA